MPSNWRSLLGELWPAVCDCGSRLAMELPKATGTRPYTSGGCLEVLAALVSTCDYGRVMAAEDTAVEFTRVCEALKPMEDLSLRLS